MTELPRATSSILGSTTEDITGTVWLLGHDLRSPVAIIISSLEMLISMYEGDDSMAVAVQLLRGSLAAANREYNMIGDVLDLARLELGKYDLEKQETDVVAMMRECIEDEAYNLTTKKITAQPNLPDEPIFLMVDPDLFKRAFSALFDNVLKFTVKDDILEIMIRRTEAGTVEIVFTDSGRAIFADFEQHIVERAPQWEKRQAGSRTSVGMGLPFANAVVKAHGGQFSAKSNLDAKLTTFTITMPVTTKTAQPDGQDSTKP